MKSLKKPEPFDNVLRHFLDGCWPNGHVQGGLKMRIHENRLKIQIFSLIDGSILKEWDKKYRIGDQIDFIGLQVAYRISFERAEDYVKKKNTHEYLLTFDK